MRHSEATGAFVVPSAEQASAVCARAGARAGTSAPAAGGAKAIPRSSARNAIMEARMKKKVEFKIVVGDIVSIDEYVLKTKGGGR